MSLNKVMLLGHLGQDPELKYTPNGTAVANFSVATSDQWTDKSGQRQEKTEWHRIVAFGKLAELCNQYLSKGRQALIEGSLQTSSWEGEDGKKRYKTEIIGRNVQFIGGRPSQDRSGEYNQEAQKSQGGAQAQQNSSQQQGGGDYEISTDSSFTADDIPF